MLRIIYKSRDSIYRIDLASALIPRIIKSRVITSLKVKRPPLPSFSVLSRPS